LRRPARARAAGVGGSAARTEAAERGGQLRTLSRRRRAHNRRSHGPADSVPRSRQEAPRVQFTTWPLEVVLIALTGNTIESRRVLPKETDQPAAIAQMRPPINPDVDEPMSLRRV